MTVRATKIRQHKRQASLHARLVISHLVVVIFSVISISIFAGSSLFNSAIDDVENNLEDLAFTGSNLLEQPLAEIQEQAQENNFSRISDSMSRLFANRPDLKYVVYLPDGSPVTSNLEYTPPQASQENTPEVWEALQNSQGESRSIRQSPDNQATLYVAVRVQQEGRVLGVLQLSIQLQQALAPARRSLGLLLFAALLAAIAVSLIGWRLANNISQPIKRLTTTASRLAQGDLSARVAPTGPPELQHLSETFNYMAGRLQDHMGEMQAFVDNASHELRTPLTIVKLRSEALLNGALDDREVARQFVTEIDAEVDRLGKIVNDLLDLSRMEAGLASKKRQPLSLNSLATETCETFNIRATRAGIELCLHAPEQLPDIMANEEQIRRVFYNLVGNAIQYTPRGGRVDVILTQDPKTKTVRLTVKDTGPGIAKEHIPHIFERFYRVEATRPRAGGSKGSGLGLAIAKSIVENHGGKIGVSSRLGEGSTFWVDLPVN